MQDCVDPDDIIEVFFATLPVMPFAGWVVLGIGVVLLAVEGVLRYGYGGVPDGIFGALGGIFAGVSIIIWASAWPEGCAGTIRVLGGISIGLAVLIGGIVLLAWRARRGDRGLLLRDY